MGKKRNRFLSSKYLKKEKGISLVTITDHNTIAGSLEIAHLPDVFVSEEVTTYFPQDQCKVHVLVYNINEAIHQELHEVRESIFDLVDYLHEKGIVHVLTHPLFAVNDRLTIEHFEQFLLLFRNFELNGARHDDQNRHPPAPFTRSSPPTLWHFRCSQKKNSCRSRFSPDSRAGSLTSPHRTNR